MAAARGLGSAALTSTNCRRPRLPLRELLRLSGCALLLLLSSPLGAARTITAFVFVPTLSRPRAIEEALELALPSVDVVVFARFSDLAAAARSRAPDAVLALPVSLSMLGLKPALQGTLGSSSEQQYVLLSRNEPSTTKRLIVGAVDVVGTLDFETYVRHLTKSSEWQSVTRVTKVVDLLPLLQFRMADTVVVAEEHVSEFRSRSRINFRIARNAGAPQKRVAVAFRDQDARRKMQAELRALGGRELLALGADHWSESP